MTSVQYYYGVIVQNDILRYALLQLRFLYARLCPNLNVMTQLNDGNGKRCRGIRTIKLFEFEIQKAKSNVAIKNKNNMPLFLFQNGLIDLLTRNRSPYIKKYNSPLHRGLNLGFQNFQPIFQRMHF